MKMVITSSLSMGEISHCSHLFLSLLNPAPSMQLDKTLPPNPLIHSITFSFGYLISHFCCGWRYEGHLIVIFLGVLFEKFRLYSNTLTFCVLAHIHDLLFFLFIIYKVDLIPGFLYLSLQMKGHSVGATLLGSQAYVRELFLFYVHLNTHDNI